MQLLKYCGKADSLCSWGFWKKHTRSSTSFKKCDKLWGGEERRRGGGGREWEEGVGSGGRDEGGGGGEEEESRRREEGKRGRDATSVDTPSGEGCNECRHSIWGGMQRVAFPYYSLHNLSQYKLKQMVRADVYFMEMQETNQRVQRGQDLYSYNLDVLYLPMGHKDVFINFEFSRVFYTCVYIFLGCVSVLVTFIQWLYHRFWTELRFPPRLFNSNYVSQVFPQV